MSESFTIQDPPDMDRLRKFKYRSPSGYALFTGLLCFLFVIAMAFLGGGLGWNTSQNDKLLSRNKLSIGDTLKFNSINGEFRLSKRSDPDVEVLFGLLTSHSLTQGFAAPCSAHKGEGTCIVWPDQVQLVIKTSEEADYTCHTIIWQALSPKFAPKDCFSLGKAHWYGGAEMANQRWPIETGCEYDKFPFIPGGGLHEYDSALIERYWISSNGIAIKADDSIPLHVTWKYHGNNTLCFLSEYSSPYKPIGPALPQLKYHICQGDDLKSTHLATANKFFPKPIGIPDERMLISPIWSTWAKYHQYINQTKLEEMADEIVSEGYTHSQLEIDDMFSTSYGAFDFDKEKFPNITKTIASFKEDKNLRVTAWITPFANVESPVFMEGLKYWVQDVSGKVPALVEWWDGIAAVLDVTNPEAVSWFTKRLKAFQEQYGIYSFKFDAGSWILLPAAYKLHSPLNNTGFFTTKFVEICAGFGQAVEVRVGYRNQNQPIFFRLQDMDSKWDYENGLKSLIPRVLYFGLVGYPFVLPDMIGGNAYSDEFPEKELYIRWLQISAFLPSWQFSITPGQYDNETVSIAKTMMNLRENFIKPYILKYAKEAVKTGMPIVRPLWWVAPKDPDAQNCDSQFLIGDEILVCPILDKGATSRDVYIPPGSWQDQISQEYVTGPKWLKDYSIHLDQIAYFVLKNEP